MLDTKVLADKDPLVIDHPNEELDSLKDPIRTITIPPPLPFSARPRAWGFWATSGLGFLIFIAWIVMQIVLGVGYFLVQLIVGGADQNGIDALLAGLEYDGLMIAFASLGSLPILVAGCFGLASLRRRHGLPVKHYLGLNPMRGKAWIFWSLVGVPFVFLVNGVLVLCGAPEIDPWVQDMADHVSGFWGLVIAIVICAPLGEELFFRGFLFKGWMESRLGKVGTVFVTSFLFAIIHLQYGIWGLIHVFMLGLLLGTARVVSGSLWAPIAIHFVNNVLAACGLYVLMMQD